MTISPRYQATLYCEKCGKATRHLHHYGQWRCLLCDEMSRLSDALSDAAEAAERLLRRRAEENRP